MPIIARIRRALFGRSETRRTLLAMHDAHAKLGERIAELEARCDTWHERASVAEAIIERRTTALEAWRYDVTRRLDNAEIPEYSEPITSDLLVDLLVEDPVIFDPDAKE